MADAFLVGQTAMNTAELAEYSSKSGNSEYKNGLKAAPVLALTPRDHKFTQVEAKPPNLTLVLR